MSDAPHALGYAAGYNIRWLLWAITRLGLERIYYALSAVLAYVLVVMNHNADVIKGAQAGWRPHESRDTTAQTNVAREGGLNSAAPTT